MATTGLKIPNTYIHIRGGIVHGTGVLMYHAKNIYNTR